MYLTGTEGDDILVGGADADTLVGLGGNDILQGGDGDDLLIGGPGRDLLDGGAGNDTVSYEDADPVGPLSYLHVNLLSQSASIVGSDAAPLDKLVSIENVIGSKGTDWLVGAAGDNVLIGGAGDDIIEGKGGRDVLDGGDGNDLITTGGIFGAAAPGSLMMGGDGADGIQSGNSNDTMLGGAGDDTLQISNYATTRHLEGGAGTDVLVFADGFANGVIVDLSQTNAQSVAAGVVVEVTGIENVYGSAGNDTLIGDSNANFLRGGHGDDTLSGGAGNDLLEGNFGNNKIDGGAGNDTVNYAVYAHGAIQTVSVSLQTGKASFVTDGGVMFQDTLTAIENVYGSNGGDVIEGDAGANSISANGGDDVITGGGGADQLDGGAGSDTFVFGAGDSLPNAPDVILGFANEDHIRFIDGPTGSSTNYAELETPDPVALKALFAGDGVRYVAMQSGRHVYLFADLGDEGTTYDQMIVLAGASVTSIDAGSILGL